MVLVLLLNVIAAFGELCLLALNVCAQMDRPIGDADRQGGTPFTAALTECNGPFQCSSQFPKGCILPCIFTPHHLKTRSHTWCGINALFKL